mmetsp:Transcript_7787/g.6883  ORF Transcript_7787/g.6883 Transcript_7787/m.6883 type:complete len:150 (+) Transcript_7787:207-656(+)
MTETLPMMIYIADKYKPELLGSTPQERATIFMTSSIIHAAKMNITHSCYTSDDKEAFKTNAWTKLEPIAKFLGDKKFFMGEKVTLPDLQIAELLNSIVAVKEGNTLEEKFPNLQALLTSVNELPEIKAFLESDRCEDFKFNNKIAHINS